MMKFLPLQNKTVHDLFGSIKLERGREKEEEEEENDSLSNFKGERETERE